jgi:protein phosphatase 2C family protein 2/3
MTGQTVGPERSGSCATVVMVIDEMIYVINVGDSRAIMSIDAGSQIGVLSRDHKPDDELEKIRIQAAGGKIYRTQTFAKAAAGPGEKDLYVQGPLRVFPGRLSVSKTFGDIEAKRPRFGGNPNVIVCDPDIKCFKVQDNFDFIMIGCDGIFERLNNRDCIDAIWDRITEQINFSLKMGGGEGSYKGGKRDDTKKRGVGGNSTSNTRKQGKNAGVSQYNEH